MIHYLRPRLLVAVAFATAASGIVLFGGGGVGTAQVPPTTAIAGQMAPVRAAPGVADTADPSTPDATTSPSPTTTPLPPTAPTGLVATGATRTSVTLSWTASTPGDYQIVGYDIVIWPAFSDYGRVVNVDDVTTTTVTVLGPGTQYEITVAARDTEGRRSTQSNKVVVVTPVASSGDTTPPAAPANLTLSGANGQSATLTWEPSTDDVAVTGYDVYWFDGWFISTFVGTTTETSYQVPLSGGSNTFYVRARDAAGNVSIASNTVAASGDGPTSRPTIKPPSPSPSTTPLSCQVTYQPLAEWTSGFVANLIITNAGQVPINGWTLTFTFPGDQVITSSWGMSYTQSGTAVSLRNMDWNATIPAGANLYVGVQGTWTASDAPPRAFVLNGTACLTG